jgi:signal transduction histidine kinase
MDVHPDQTRSAPSVPGRHADGQGGLGEVLAHLSDELCRPLAALREESRRLLMGDGRFSGDQRVHLGTICSLCDDLHELTRHYLEYAGLAHCGPNTPVRSTIGTILGAIDHQIAAEAAAREVAWRWRLDGPDVPVWSDAELCRRLLAKLLDLSLRRTPPGGRLQVSAKGSMNRWSATITDSGPRLSPDTVTRALDAGYQLSREETSTDAGISLTLAVCRALAANLGGEMVVRPAPRRGNRFIVTLPLDPPPDAGGPAKQAPGRARGSGGRAKSRRTG